MLIVDTAEKNEFIKKAGDEQRALYYVGPNGERFSYDLLLTMKDGTTLKAERKSWTDALGTFIDNGRLDRQCAAVDMLIVEQGIFDFDANDQLHKNLVAHLAVLNMNLPVHITGGPADTIDLLRRFERRDIGIKVRENRVARTIIDDARQGIVRALLAGSGHSPDRLTPNGAIGLQIEACIDWQALSQALRTETWVEGVEWDGRTPSPKTIAKILARLMQPGQESGPPESPPPAPPEQPAPSP